MKRIIALIALAISLPALADISLRVQAPTEALDGAALTGDITLTVLHSRVETMDAAAKIILSGPPGKIHDVLIKGCGDFYIQAYASNAEGDSETVPQPPMLLTDPCPSYPPKPPVFLSESALHTLPPSMHDGTLVTAYEYNDQFVLARPSGRWVVKFRLTSFPTADAFAGLVSRDNNGRDDPGHLTLYVAPDGMLSLRMQTTTANLSLDSAAGAITLGEMHTAVVSFGDQGAALFLDGVQLGRDPSWVFGLDGNTLPLTIGAVSWVALNRTSEPKRHPFNGEIAEVSFYETQISG